MDYEKAYKETLERAKKWYNAQNSDKMPTYANRIIEEIFPELCESEDEMISKKIKKVLNWYRKSFSEKSLRNEEYDEMFAWLEKQDENKPVVIIPKFRVGDEIKTSNEESLTITKIDEKGYWSEDLFICDFDNADKWELIEQKLTDKVEPKFKVGDWVVVSTTKGDRVVQIASVEYFKNGYPGYTTTEGRWFDNGTKARLLTDKDTETITLPESKIITYKDKEKQGNPTDNDMVEALRTEYEKGRADAIAQMQQEWSEEDECYMAECINAIATKDGWSFEEKRKTKHWLKSIKDRVQPQNTWKPSDAQMVALKKAISQLDLGLSRVLNTLYNDLDKLTKE